MIEKGSLVRLVHMEHEYSTGFYKPWQNGLVGTVINYTRVVNVNDGHVTELCSIDLLVPFLSVGGNPIRWVTGIDVRNLEEITRVPIIRKPVIDGGE